MLDAQAGLIQICAVVWEEEVRAGEPIASSGFVVPGLIVLHNAYLEPVVSNFSAASLRARRYSATL